MIYLPIDDFSFYNSYSVIDKDTIRAYLTAPTLNTNCLYDDYYINSHYLVKSGSELISSIPTFISTDKLTNNIYYRNDMPDILLMFLILCIFCFYIPLNIFKRFFRKV